MITDTWMFTRFPGSVALVIGAAITAAIAVPSPLLEISAASPTSVVRTKAPSTAPRASKACEIPFKEARIYWEYNASANDLGVHVSLDAEDWKRLDIEKPNGSTLFQVKGKGPYQALGMTELFFEGAEPSLEQFPLANLLALFPEGNYAFEGKTVDGEDLESTAAFTHAIPAGPVVSATLGANHYLRIDWSEVTSPPPGFPNRPIVVQGYQVIVGRFQVTLPAAARSVTVPPEFVASLASGEQPYEVLAIEIGGNQTLTEGIFIK